MTIAENIRLEQEMSIIRDPLDQTKQMTVNADGSISVSRLNPLLRSPTLKIGMLPHQVIRKWQPPLHLPSP